MLSAAAPAPPLQAGAPPSQEGLAISVTSPMLRPAGTPGSVTARATGSGAGLAAVPYTGGHVVARVNQVSGTGSRKRPLAAGR
jgi:hypothetical protein